MTKAKGEGILARMYSQDMIVIALLCSNEFTPGKIAEKDGILP